MQESSFSKDIHKGATSLALLLCVAYTLSFAAAFFCFFDILRHFIFQYLVGASVLGTYFLIQQSKQYALIMGLIVLSTGCEIYFSTPKAPLNTDPANLKVALFNKLFYTPNSQEILKWIAIEKPDILVIQEADPDMLRHVQNLPNYPYLHHAILTNPFGFLMLSRYSLENASVGYTQEYVINNIYGHVVMELSNEISVSVYAAHPVPPVSGKHSKQRNTDIEIMSEKINADKSKNVILLGDFNITPYSPYFKDLLHATALKNEYISHLPVPSWPSAYIDYIFQIPIDHILHKGDLQLIEKRRGPAMGSDHYPLIATYAIQ